MSRLFSSGRLAIITIPMACGSCTCDCCLLRCSFHQLVAARHPMSTSCTSTDLACRTGNWVESQLGRVDPFQTGSFRTSLYPAQLLLFSFVIIIIIIMIIIINRFVHRRKVVTSEVLERVIISVGSALCLIGTELGQVNLYIG